ncbi:unnamed protein product [Rotaria sp. Silwood1]|nr:unnamed protein product [Rotaria sp. Silwood1]
MSTTKYLSCSSDKENNAEDIVVITSDNVNNSLLDTEMTCEKIHMLLMKKSLTIADASKHHKADCWQRFGFPAVTNKNGNVIKKFHSFVSCRDCFITYSFKSNSTTLMNRHKCNNSSFSSSVQNMEIFVWMMLYTVVSVSLHIAELADEYRAKVRQELIEPLENQAVTICPDLWTDPYRQISYLGISVCFTNDKYHFITYDLCCAPFTENDKKAPSIIAAIKKALEPFGITDLTKVNFVSDRGANLVKALKPYSTTNCVAHRLNNIVKVGFYQTNKKRKNNKIDPSEILEIICSSGSENDSDCSEDGDREKNEEGEGSESSETNDKYIGNNKSVGRATSSCILDYSTITLSEIPPSALNILKTIVTK